MSEDLKKPWDYDNRIPYEYPKIVHLNFLDFCNSVNE